MSEDYTDDPTCPYCHKSYQAEGADGDYEAEGTETQCPSCEKNFLLTAHHSVSFSGRKMDCKDDNHEYQAAERCELGVEYCERKNRQDGKIHTPCIIWSRKCKNCDEEQYQETPLDGKNPWGEVKN